MRTIHGFLRGLKPFVSSTFYRQYCNVKQANGLSLIEVDKFKAVTILSINRPDKQNAMNEALLNELATHLTQFENDADARVIVLNGIGGNFCAGYDMDELKQKCQENKDTLRSSLFFPFRRKTSKPFLCSLSGYCSSIGLEIALMCDFRYVEDNTILSFSNRKLGIPLLNDGPKRLATLVGMSRAIDMIFFDHEINAQTAVDMGLAFGPVKNGTVLGAAMKTAVHLSTLPQAALYNDLESLYGWNSIDRDDANRWSSITNDIQSNINLDESSLKSARVSKLNNMADWELQEIEHEQNYLKRQQQKQQQSDQMHSK